MGGGQSVSHLSASGKTIIVTGGNTGIGYETAKQLAQLGAKVIIACRSQERALKAIENMNTENEQELVRNKETGETKADDAPQLDVRFMQLDLASLESTVNFAREYIKSGLPLNVLICNAGIASPEKVITADGFESHFQINYLSHFLLTLLLLPKLKESAPDSRIVNVSSIAHDWSPVELDLMNIQAQKSTYTIIRFYGNSKLFQIMNMHSLSRKLNDTGISIFSLHPGTIKTDITRSSNGWQRVLATIYFYVFGVDTNEGAKTSIIAAIDPRYDEETALYLKSGNPVDSNTMSRDKTKQDILWMYSLQCLKKHLTDEILEGIGEKLENITDLEDAT